MKNKIEIAVKAIIRKKGKYLILLKSKEENDPKSFDIPGGRMEFGEDPKSALIREVKEETDLDVKIIKPTNVWSYNANKELQIIAIAFLAECKSDKIRISKEHSKYEWLSFEEIIKIDSWVKREIEIAEKG